MSLRCTQLSRPLKTNESAAERKVVELNKALKSKDEKIKGYRNMVVKLKEEFIKLEEDKAIEALRDKNKEKEREKERSLYNTDYITIPISLMTDLCVICV
jgi:allophanate hydrolase subunit 1